MECEHKNITKNTPQIKKIAGGEFHYEAHVCCDCGSVLWNKEIEQKYNLWTSDNRDLFTIQFSIPNEVKIGINEIISSYPNATESHFVRAVLSVFLGFIFSNEIISEAINHVSKDDTFKRLSNSKKRIKMKTRMNPTLYEGVETWANILGMTSAKFIEDALTRIVAVFVDRDKIDLWNKEIDQKIDVILMAA